MSQILWIATKLGNLVTHLLKPAISLEQCERILRLTVGKAFHFSNFTYVSPFRFWLNAEEVQIEWLRVLEQSTAAFVHALHERITPTINDPIISEQPFLMTESEFACVRTFNFFGGRYARGFLPVVRVVTKPC
jgi:hypothetical protein